MKTTYRYTMTPSDPDTVRDIINSSGFFNTEEVEIAVELADEALKKGNEASGYHFLFMEIDGKTAGYACYGRIPGTQASFDLYWIAIHNDFRGQGLGKQVLAESEKMIVAMGGQRVYIETSSQKKYLPTQKFYRTTQYDLEAVLTDFYAPGDSKMIFRKVLA